MTEYFEPIIGYYDGYYVLILQDSRTFHVAPLLGFDGTEATQFFISKWIEQYEEVTGMRFERHLVDVPEVYLKAFGNTTLEDYEVGTWFEGNYY